MTSRTGAALALILPWVSESVSAEAVDLPVPFLEWSFYVLLLFGVAVAIGIFIRRGRGERSETLNHLMKERGTAVHSVTPEVSVTDCVQLMDKLKIGAMLVMEGERLLGIFTERDAMSRVLATGLNPTETPVSAVMTADLVCVSPDTSLEAARRLVTSRRIRHLPIVERGRVLGMVSSGDLTHWLVRSPDRSRQDRDVGTGQVP